jgi:uncharacterized protein YjiS (DUF1127 family)
MWPQYISNPEFVEYREHALRARNEAMARAGYLAIVGLARLQAGTARLVGRWLAQSAAGLRAWRERRVALRALQGLDDRMLRDIGLTRADLLDFARRRPLPAGAGEAPRPAAVVVTLDAALDAYAAGACDDGWRQAA